MAATTAFSNHCTTKAKHLCFAQVHEVWTAEKTREHTWDVQELGVDRQKKKTSQEKFGSGSSRRKGGNDHTQEKMLVWCRQFSGFARSIF